METSDKTKTYCLALWNYCRDTQPTFSYSNSIMETTEQCAKSVQS